MTATFVSYLPATNTASALSGSSFNKARIIDDGKFYRQSSMSVTAIQNFLNSKVPVCDTNGTQQHWSGVTRAERGTAYGNPPPFICLKDFSQNTPLKIDSSGFCSGMSAKTNWSAARIIFDVANACKIDAKVLLVMLEKEQSLVTDDWPWDVQYEKAMGYYCPDDPNNPGYCNPAYAGFFNQVYNAARQFNNYRANPNSFNYAKGRNSYVAYQANTPSCGGTNITMYNHATAGLYNYTPYQPNQAALNNLYGTGNSCSAYGNRNFWRLYNDWFGPTINTAQSCTDSSNVSGADTGRSVLNVDRTLAFTKLNNTGSTCTEIHTWNNTYSGWSSNVATNLNAQDPNNKDIITADTNGDGKDEFILVKYASNTNKVELHAWDSTKKRWAFNVATNLNQVSPSNGAIIAGDTNRDGKDELMFVKYKNTGSGKVEVHTWAKGYRSWASNIVTNLNDVDPTKAQIITGNVLGDYRDELLFIKYLNTPSNKLEVHIWQAGYKKWAAQVQTNVSNVDPSTREVVSGNVYGGMGDELLFIKYNNTGSSKVEVHTWAPGSWYKNWITNRATNLNEFDPTT